MFTGDIFDADGGDRQSIALLEPPYQTEASYRATFSGGNLLTRWTRKHSERSTTQLQAYYDYSTRDDLFIRDTSFSITDVELQRQRDFSRHRLIGGIGFRLNHHNQRADWVARYNPRQRTTNRLNTFIQDEITLVPDKLLLTLGTKLERSTFAEVQLQPSASLLWNRSPRDTVWVSFSRATRSPSRVDHDLAFTAFAAPGPDDSLTVVEVFSNPDIESERMLNYEAGYRWTLQRGLSFDLAGFYNVYEGVIARVSRKPFVRPGPPFTTVLPMYFENALDPVVYGAEAAAAWRPTESTDLRFNYTYLGGGLDTGADVPGPNHQFHARWFWRLHRKLEWSSGYFFVDNFSGVAAYHRVDTRLGWRPSPRWEFSVVGQNLLDNQHLETPPVLSLAAEVGRSIYAKTTLHF
jgi:iron complex outermembrane receptor protein